MRGALLAGLLAGLALAGPAQAATIQVDTTDDELNGDPDCSLREAVQAARFDNPVSGCERGQASKRDVVKLQPGEIYTLDIAASTHEDSNANGDLDIFNTGPVTIKGNSRSFGGPVIDAPANDRAIDVFDVAGSVKVVKLNLEGGDVSALGFGESEGGVLRAEGAAVKVDDVNLQHGRAKEGGALAALDGRLIVSDSALGQNDATVLGGGIAAMGDVRRFRLLRSTVSSNEVIAPTFVSGGGIVSAADRTEIADATVQFNDVETTGSSEQASGGGVYAVSEELTIRRSLIQGNRADDAGGASSSSGAGVASAGIHRFAIVNSTLVDNDVDGTGGALYTAGRGAVSNVTFTANAGGDAGDDMAVNGTGPLKLRNSILPGFSDDLCAGSPGSFASRGHNVIQFDDPQCAFTNTDAEVTDVGFADGVPSNNGGPTFTIGIENQSPAKDLVPRRKCKVAQGEDQRGYKRPKGKKCDAGAFERGASP